MVSGFEMVSWPGMRLATHMRMTMSDSALPRGDRIYIFHNLEENYMNGSGLCWDMVIFLNAHMHLKR